MRLCDWKWRQVALTPTSGCHSISLQAGRQAIVDSVCPCRQWAQFIPTLLSVPASLQLTVVEFCDTPPQALLECPLSVLLARLCNTPRLALASLLGYPGGSLPLSLSVSRTPGHFSEFSCLPSIAESPAFASAVPTAGGSSACSLCLPPPSPPGPPLRNPGCQKAPPV